MSFCDKIKAILSFGSDIMYQLAVDIGASSGRHILGWLENGIMKYEEVYRFYNGLDDIDGTLCWDTERLFSEIKNGLKKCAEIGKIPSTMAIDTWGVDFVLLGADGKKIGKSVGYRDSRTEGIVEKAFKVKSQRELYDITGLGTNTFNTLFQLIALKQTEPEVLENAVDFLMIPDYFVYLLTGNKFNEYTNASTTELIDVHTNTWSEEILDAYGIKKSIFKELSLPGTKAGRLLPEIRDEVGFDLDVVLAASHDTASAVMSVPSNGENVMYISSGTWSLMGIESKLPQLHDICMEHSFTNEGGYDYRYRVLKNIMGLWMIQNVKKEFDDKYSFAELCAMAEEEDGFESTVDAVDNRFLAPKNMTEEIKAYCCESGQRVPETVGQIATAIYNSLAKCYADCADEIEQFTGKQYSAINIIGGGSNADYLNKITAKVSGRNVLAGPSEATAIGNIMAQMLSVGKFSDLGQARETVIRSFEIKEYKA